MGGGKCGEGRLVNVLQLPTYLGRYAREGDLYMCVVAAVGLCIH